MAAKDLQARWQPGTSGNPKGRPPGIAKVAKARDAIAKHVPKIITKLAEAALAGDVAAARVLIERVIPVVKPAELPVPMNLPPAADATDHGRAVMLAAAAGDLAPGQAAALMAALGNLGKLIEVGELLRRIEALESAAKKEPNP